MAKPTGATKTPNKTPSKPSKSAALKKPAAAKKAAAPTKSPSTKLPAAKKRTDKKAVAMLKLVLKSLDTDKAEEVVSIDLRYKTPIADYMVVASGRSGRHVSSLAEHLARRLKEAGHGTAHIEGMKQGDWVLIDGGDVVIHIFRPEVRDFYKLEKMWAADIPADQIAV